MNINLEKLKFNKENERYEDGYRIVYFYDDKYSIGEYCKTIEGFMLGFAESNPILEDEDIPPFVSNDDLLDRYLNDLPDVNEVAIYKIDETLVDKKSRGMAKK